MPTINLSRVVNSPNLAQSFTALRSSGQFGLGGWQNTTTSVSMYGVVSVATSDDLEMVPEGDRVIGAMVFHSSQPMYRTRDANTSGGTGLSDLVLWRGEQYRILYVAPYADYGFYRAIAVRILGS